MICRANTLLSAWRRAACLAQTRRAFTVVEVLIGVLVVGVLVALLIPAVQRSRETARRTYCQNNLRQVGTALLAYQSSIGSFPPGTIWPKFQYDSPRTPYLPHLFPFFPDLVELYDKIDWSVTGTLWCQGNNVEAIGTPVPALLCPSDRLGGKLKANPYCGSTAVTNYMGFFGETMADVYIPKAVFGANFGARPEDIVDGASHTLAFGEYLSGTPQDLRGQMWGDEAAGSLIFTLLSPNSRQPDLLYPNPKIWQPSDPAVNNPALNLPFDFGDGFKTDTAASRSRHAGGVNVLFADGAARFISNAVDLGAWHALGTIAD